MPTHPESKAYIAFMEETGAEFVSAYIRWVYFRKKATDGPFDIYSDIDSRIAHYKRIAKLWGIIGFINLMAFFINIHWIITAQAGITFNFGISIINLILGGLLVCLCIPYYKKIKQLKKEKQLHE